MWRNKIQTGIMVFAEILSIKWDECSGTGLGFMANKNNIKGEYGSLELKISTHIMGPTRLRNWKYKSGIWKKCL